MSPVILDVLHAYYVACHCAESSNGLHVSAAHHGQVVPKKKNPSIKADVIVRA
jgi:hypothetical protein